MRKILPFAALLGCGGSEAPTPAGPEAPVQRVEPKPVTSPPQAELPPPTPAAGGPIVTIPGNFYAEELKVADGEEVQVLCGDRLLTQRVSLLPVGEGRVHPTVPDCPDYQILFRGLSDRMGSGSITRGIGMGPFTVDRPRDFEAGYSKGVFAMTGINEQGGYTVELRPTEGEAQALFTQAVGTGLAGLNWVGDLDDDNVPDFVLNSPVSKTEAHMRLFLSAKSASRKPEQVAEFVFTLW